jgi:hypothetical protein
MLKDSAGKELKAEWKAVKPNEVEVKLPLQEAQPGAMTLMVTQSGISQPQPIPIHAFSEAGRFEGFRIHVGDVQGMLQGSRLDEVASLSIGSLVFLPGELSSQNGSDELPMIAQDAQAVASLKPEHSMAAKVTLRDGRVLPLIASVEAPRPRITLISKSVQPSPSSDSSNIRLMDSELPQDATLIFSVRTQSPAAFSRDESIEIATSDQSFTTTLSVGNGGMTLENSHVAVATFKPAKAFGLSAFGPLQFRANDKAVTGDWQPLADLVRLPALNDIKCPSAPILACKLSGSNLFLIDSVASDPQFLNPVQVPDGFLGSALPVPHPTSGALYLRLRDDPNVINLSTLTADQIPDSPDDMARSESRQPATAKDDGAGIDPPAYPPAANDANHRPLVIATPLSRAAPP